MNSPVAWQRMELHAQAVSEAAFAGICRSLICAAEKPLRDYFSAFWLPTHISATRMLSVQSAAYTANFKAPSPSSTCTVAPSGMPPRRSMFANGS